MTTTPKPPVYRIFRSEAPGRGIIILQVRCPESGKLVQPDELEAYRATATIRSPWHGLEKLPAGSRLLLTPATARFLLAAGSVAAMQEPPLILTRESRAPGGNRDLGGTPEPARKAGGVASCAR